MDARPELYFKTLNSKIDAFHDYNKLRKETNPKAYEKFIDKYQFEWMIVSHTRGSVPHLVERVRNLPYFFPHTWECSYSYRRYRFQNVLFPTHVGVFPLNE